MEAPGDVGGDQGQPRESEPLQDHGDDRRGRHTSCVSDHLGVKKLMVDEPTRHHEVLKSALKTAFGLARIDSITPISPGLSAAPYRVVVGDRRFLVRIEGPASPLRNPHQYDSMLIAAKAGIAPNVRFVDQAARVAIVDFIEEQPLSSYPGGPDALARALGDMVRRVQATPRFQTFVEYPDLVARLWAHVCRTGLFASGVLDKHTEHLSRLRKLYAWDEAASVSSHNDIVPGNVLFDGERLWMVDWESAYRNDPLVDIAIAIDSFAFSPESASELLRAYTGRLTDEALYGRLARVRAFTRLYYAGVFLSASAAANGSLGERDLSVPTSPEYRSAIFEGRLKPGAVETLHVLGKLYLNAFLTGASPPGLDAPSSGSG